MQVRQNGVSSHRCSFDVPTGYGSNLTLDGRVECDASIMDGRTSDFGSVGAVSGWYTVWFGPSPQLTTEQALRIRFD